MSTSALQITTPPTNEDFDPAEISNLSDAQERWLSLIPILPCLLSITGSCIIIYMIFFQRTKQGAGGRQQRKQLNPYKRLLVGMSTCDIITSITMPFWSFLIPSASSYAKSASPFHHVRIWAIGNYGTCTMLGFFSQFSFSGILYNCMLSYFFLLTARFGRSNDDIAKWYEPIMHIVSIGYPLLTGIVGIVLGVYHETQLGLSCWVTNYPENCGTDAGETGETCLGPRIAWLFGGIVIFFCLISVPTNNIRIYRYVHSTIYAGQRRRSSTTTTDATVGGVTTAQTRRVQAVAAQASLYVGTFAMTYMWTVVLRIIESTPMGQADQEQSLFPLLVMQAICLPANGFMNMFVFVRPKYLTVRRDYPAETRLWAVQRAVLGETHQRQQHGRSSDPRQKYDRNGRKLQQTQPFDSSGTLGAGRLSGIYHYRSAIASAAATIDQQNDNAGGHRKNGDEYNFNRHDACQHPLSEDDSTNSSSMYFVATRENDASVTATTTTITTNESNVKEKLVDAPGNSENVELKEDPESIAQQPLLQQQANNADGDCVNHESSESVHETSSTNDQNSAEEEGVLTGKTIV